MPSRNFRDDSISYPYLPDSELQEDDIVHQTVEKVAPGGYTGVDEAWAGHFVAWVPLEVNGVLRTTTHHESPQVLKPTYVQSEGAINIGPGERWGGMSVAIFVLREQLDETQRTAVE